MSSARPAAGVEQAERTASHSLLWMPAQITAIA
jgi:hypothetical protein